MGGFATMTETTRAVQDLIDRAGGGEVAARHELLEHYRDHLRRMVGARLDRRLAPRVDPSDVVQEALADASRRMDEYLEDRPLPFFAWLRQLAGERLIDAHRRHVLSQRRSINRESRPSDLPDDSAVTLAQRLVSDDTSPSNRLIREESRGRVLEALAGLSPRDRDVLVMRHLEQLSTAEIADALGVSVGAVESRLLRALLRLRGRMESNP
jgi:RNA polymerase sigma-70 factor, ECF subfamily